VFNDNSLAETLSLDVCWKRPPSSFDKAMSASSSDTEIKRRIREAATRALAEAAARRTAAKPVQLPPERGGRAGPEPTRYGDWEKDGIISDF
jgi:hypothetical protein